MRLPILSLLRLQSTVWAVEVVAENKVASAPRAEEAVGAEPLEPERLAPELLRLKAVFLRLGASTTLLVAVVAAGTAIRPRRDGLSGAAAVVVVLAKLVTLDLTARVVCTAEAEAGAVQL